MDVDWDVIKGWNVICVVCECNKRILMWFEWDGWVFVFIENFSYVFKELSGFFFLCIIWIFVLVGEIYSKWDKLC